MVYPFLLTVCSEITIDSQKVVKNSTEKLLHPSPCFPVLSPHQQHNNVNTVTCITPLTQLSPVFPCVFVCITATASAASELPVTPGGPTRPLPSLAASDLLQDSCGRGLPGGPVVRTPHFHCRGTKIPVWELRPRMLRDVAKKKKKRKLCK